MTETLGLAGHHGWRRVRQVGGSEQAEASRNWTLRSRLAHDSPIKRLGRRIVAVVSVLLGICGVAHAQSAVDDFNPGANGAVHALALQADGKILIGGTFTMLGGGGTGTTPRHSIGRLNADGSLDTTFEPGADFGVEALAVEADGKILVGGYFQRMGGGGTGTTSRNGIGRLNADGSLDTGFDLGANNFRGIHALAVQADGKILVGGTFTTMGSGTGTSNICRLNTDGSLDRSFNPGANGAVNALTLQADGKILVTGEFTRLGGGGTGTTTRNFIGRLNADGSLDTTFNPGADFFGSALTLQPDGMIVVGGAFGALGGAGAGTTPHIGVGRLSADGSLDASFNPGMNSGVRAVALQPDGKILIAGYFTTLGGGGAGTTTRNYIGRLNADGSLDTSFNPGANSGAFALAVQPDGKVLVGGGFTTLGGGGTGTTTRNFIGRLNADVSSRVPAITKQPTSQTVTAGTSATFTVAASGTPAPTLQWQVSTNSGTTFTDLVNASPHSGSTTATLTIDYAPSSFNGLRYRAVATNSVGWATSSAAMLTVTVRTNPTYQDGATGTTGGGDVRTDALPVFLSTLPGSFLQEGPKLVGTGAVGNDGQGRSVSLSADGNTAIIGGLGNSDPGAAWVWTRSGGVWTQQGTKLVGSGAVGTFTQFQSVSVSGDGNTAIVGGGFDNTDAGAAWVWTRSGGVWTQQGTKLVGSGAVGAATQGASVSLSADGNTAIIGGGNDNGAAGAAWVWTRSGGVWTQQGTKLVGSGAVGAAQQGSVFLSGDGNTAIIGGGGDNNGAGAAWVWTRSGGVWTQQGTKLIGSGAVGNAFQGESVSLSKDGNTAIVGGYADNSSAGAAWVWTRSGGVWTQQGTKLVGPGAAGNAAQGISVSLSADGNTAIIGGGGDNNGVGAAWVWTRSGGVWTRQGTKLVGSGAAGNAQQGRSVSLSAAGDTAIVGGPGDNSNAGAAWVFAVGPPSSPTPLLPGGATEGQTISSLTPTLQWTPGDGAISYAIAISARPYGSSSVVYSNASALGTALTLPSGVLVNGGSYRWEMTAINSAGASVVSTSLYFQVMLSGIPPLPSPPVALSPGSGLGSGPALDTLTPTFRWTPSNGASTYGLRISVSPYGPSDVIFSNLAIAGTSFTLPRPVLAIGTQYRWNVTAINSGGESAASNSMYFVLRDSPSVLPAAPTGLTATWANGHARLAWADMSSNESGFKIERSDGSGTYGQIATTGQNTNLYTDTVAATTIDHCYRVRATNGAGDSAYSNESCIARMGTSTAAQHLQFSTTAYPAGPSGAPVTITRTGGSTGTVTVTVLVSQGTAVTGPAGDYSSLGTIPVTFAPGDTSKTVTVLHVQLQHVDDRTVNLALTGPTGDATLGSPSAAVMTIQGTGSTHGRILIQDPVCIRGPVGKCDGDGLLQETGFPDPTKLAQLVSVNGAVADGVTLLVLSVTSSTAVTFSLSDTSDWPKYGTLMPLDGSTSASSVTVTPTGSTAHALFRAPIDSPWKDDELPVGVTATNSVGTVIANGRINLRFPPVVFVHGLWSSPTSSFEHLRWGDLLRLTGRVVADADYSANSADTFNPYEASAPIDALVFAVKVALDTQRAKGIAASQVDVVAHSMGGLVARARENDHGPRILFHRNENRKYGEFHKLITIGSPHQGSRFASALAEHKCTWRVQKYFVPDRPINQAVYDLQPTSWTLYWLGSTVVPTHAIAGIKPASSFTESQMKFLLGLAGLPSLDSILGSDGQHDTLVRVVSQEGGLKELTTATRWNGVVHSTGMVAQVADDTITETTSPGIFGLILDLLAARTKGSLFGSIGTYTPVGGVDRANLPCSGQLSSARIASGASTLSPAPGTLVRPGDVIQIEFSVPAASTSAMISIGGQMTVVTGSTGFFSTTYQLPPDVTGRIDISATTLDLGSGDLSGSTYVVALPSTPPSALSASPGLVDFAVQGSTTPLTVIGTYGDGATAELTSSASGTVYSTQSGTNAVITISAEGLVQAVANGQDTIVIQNGGQIASVTATVNITNHRPTLAALVDATLAAGQTLNVPIAASDSDGDHLLFSGSGLPSFVTLVDNHDGTGALSIRPGATDGGIFPMYISVVDDGAPALGLSRSFTLTVQTMPAFTTHPADQTVTAGANATFTVAAGGTPVPIFQWQASTNSGASFSNLTETPPYSGVTASTLSITGATSAMNGNQYRAVANNSVGSVPSNAAVLTVNTPPTITAQPLSQTIRSGQTATLSVGAAGTTPLTYEWYLGTSGTTTFPIGGATSSSYTTPALTSATSYWVRVSNSAGIDDSNTATITTTIYQPFTDDTLTGGLSVIRAVHITELRTRIDALRLRRGLGLFAWNEPALTVGGSPIRAQHIIDLRTALLDVYVAAGLTPATYTDPILGTGTPMKAAHITEIRAAIIGIE